MKIPKKITPCPIDEAVVEIRFKPKCPPDAIFGILHNSFKDDFPNYNELDILKLPPEIRTKDSNLKYRPHYRMFNDKFLFQIGPRVISLINKNDYIGWKDFFLKIDKTLDKIKSLDIISCIKRIGLRYINFFQDDIFKNIKLKVELDTIDLSGKEKNIFCSIPIKGYLNQVRISNNVTNVISKNKKPILGSLIDIDTYILLKDEPFNKSIIAKIDKGHNVEKEIFFSLLKDNFLTTLNPEY